MAFSSLYFAFCILLSQSSLNNATYSNEGNSIKNNNANATVEFLLDYLSVKYPSENFEDMIYIGIKRQELFYIKQGKLLKLYHISSSAEGAGNVFGSNKTPVGLHTVQKKIGKDVPLGGIFKSKKFIGKIAEINVQAQAKSESDKIITRILTLQGEEIGINKGNKSIDSYHRRIYIHGTPEEGLIGQPASHGCIRMKSADVIELFDYVPLGINVVILNN